MATRATSVASEAADAALPAVSASLDSILESVEKGTESVCRFAQDAGFEEQDRYFIAVAVREILTNAIKHGNRFDPHKKVGLRVSENDGDLTIEVADQGDGFDLGNVPNPLAVENRERTSGRGVKIARALMDYVTVETKQEGGANVRMVKHLPARANP
jgi:serine/threonine-protein kinase RsbW